MERVLAKLKLDSHHKMERFGVIVVVLLCLICITVSFMFRKYINDNKEVLTSQSLYTSSFEGSRTGIQGTAVDVYTNKNKTKAFVLLKFNDVSNISTNASDYNLFMTGSSLSGAQETLKARPTGCIYMFGNTGYMGVYLVNNQGFESQIINMTVRNNKELVTKESAEDVVYDDVSFSEYDQFSIYFNPGASGTGYVECLEESGSLSAFDIYNELVVHDAEQACRDTLNNDLKIMSDCVKKIMDYRTSRFVNDGVAIPELPSELKGDNVYLNEDNGLYYIETENLIPGGYNINWQDGSIKNGYLDSICEGMSYPEFFAKKEKEVAETEDSTQSWNEQQWYRTDGSQIIMGENRLEYESTIQDDIEGYKAELSTYYTTKEKYFREDMYDLLLLEANAKSVDSYYTVNDDENVLMIY